MKKLLFTLLMCGLLLSGCGDNASKNNDNGGTTTTNSESANGETNANAEDATTTAAEPEYVFPELNGEGKDFKVLSVDNDWDFNCVIVPEETTGESLNDSIFARNALIDEKFNIKIVQELRNIGDTNKYLQKSVKAGEDEYDAAFIPAYWGGTVGALATQKMIYNLNDISTINLDGNYWNQQMRKEAQVIGKNKVYYLGSGVNIMTLEAMTLVYFNQEMVNNLGLDLPYDLVRQGKWTIDKMGEYMKAGAQLNGEADWTFTSKEGKSVWALTSYDNAAAAFMDGSGEGLIELGSDGTPKAKIGTERLMSVILKIQELMTPPEMFHYGNSKDTGNHYELLFSNSRALFCMGELKAAKQFRNMETTFGVLPVPKYDEKQSAYYGQLIYQAPVLVIPVTNPRTELTGAVVDAWTYVSDKDVTPVLFDNTVTQKLLRNAESVEMLQIMKNSGSFEIGCAYNWTVDFYNEVRYNIGDGGQLDVASTIEKFLPKIESKIADTMAAMQ